MRRRTGRLVLFSCLLIVALVMAVLARLVTVVRAAEQDVPAPPVVIRDQPQLPPVLDASGTIEADPTPAEPPLAATAAPPLAIVATPAADPAWSLSPAEVLKNESIAALFAQLKGLEQRHRELAKQQDMIEAKKRELVALLKSKIQEQERDLAEKAKVIEKMAVRPRVESIPWTPTVSGTVLPPPATRAPASRAEDTLNKLLDRLERIERRLNDLERNRRTEGALEPSKNYAPEPPPVLPSKPANKP